MELLIHISTPTSRRDDDKYRAEALACQGFEVVNTIELTATKLRDTEHGKGEGAPGERLLTRPLSSAETRPPVNSIDRRSPSPTSTQRSRTMDGNEDANNDRVMPSRQRFPTDMFPRYEIYEVSRARKNDMASSSRNPMERLGELHNRWSGRQSLYGVETPRSRYGEQLYPSSPAKGRSQGFVENTQLALQALETQIVTTPQDLSWQTSPIDARAMKRRRLSQRMRQGSLSDPLPASNEVAARQPSPHTPENALEHEADSLASELPLTYGLNKSNDSMLTPPIPTSSSPVANRTASCDEATAHALSSGTAEQIAIRQASAGIHRSLGQGVPQSDKPNAAPLTDGSSQIGAKNAQDRLPVPARQLPPACGRRNSPGEDKTVNTPASGEDVPVSKPASMSFDFAGLPDIVLPPEMPTSSERHTKLPSQVSDTLRQLANNPELMARYRPVHVARPIEDLERGYWSVDTSSWPKELQWQFWTDLVRYHGAGRLGYLVTLSRPRLEGFDPASGLGTVRLFCWGEVVSHMYLVLYALSNGRVRDVGAQYSSAIDGSVLVQMRSSTTSSG